MFRKEAKQYIKLNPGEEVKYGEYWAQAVGDNETVGGKEAVAFLGRAAKVSKGQLRRIWDVADHQKEGSLGRDEFYIALRLVALAQRGAELSVAGLRNFSGINLIPNIAPEVKKEPAVTVTAPGNANAFSWTVPPAVIAKYDSFFKSLDVAQTGMIDGKQGVTFFGKSGLPRPTLKRIWELADVTRDGKLSLEEFRTAMHMVSNIRNKRLTVTALPSVMDPSGPNWLRIEGQDMPAPVAEANPLEQLQQAHMQSPGQTPVIVPIPPHGLQPQASPSQQESVFPSPKSQTHTTRQPPSHPEMEHQEQALSPAPRAPPSQTLSPAQQMPPPNHQVPHFPPPPSDHLVQSQEAEKMREALQKERLEVERARREMEDMKVEMERLKLEKASFSATPLSSSVNEQSARNADSYGTRRSPKVSPVVTRVPAPPAAFQPPRPPSVSPSVAAKLSPIIPAQPPAPPPTLPSAAIPPTRTEPISLGNDDDDDIWDQPSPKASALPGPSVDASKRNTKSTSKNSVSSDDDDDFWGGLGTTPTLGPAGGQKPGEAKNKGFGGSELDDWVF